MTHANVSERMQSSRETIESFAAQVQRGWRERDTNYGGWENCKNFFMIQKRIARKLRDVSGNKFKILPGNWCCRFSFVSHFFRQFSIFYQLTSARKFYVEKTSSRILFNEVFFVWSSHFIEWMKVVSADERQYACACLWFTFVRKKRRKNSTPRKFLC